MIYLTFKKLLTCAAAGWMAFTVLRADDVVPARKPAVLFSAWNFAAVSSDVANRLVAEGFAVRKTPSTGDHAVPLTWEEARKYNVIVMVGIGEANGDNSLSATNRTTIATLNRFMQEGGGVLYLPEFFEMDAQIAPQLAFGQPLGLKPLFAELVFDPAQAIPATLFKVDMAPTTDITPSPITKGVTSLWYPSAMRTGDEDQVVTFQADPSWHVVVTGSKTSFSRTVPTEIASTNGKEGDPGQFKGSVPLVAYKEVGKGRIVVCGITAAWLSGTYANTTLEGVVLDHGLNGVPSYGYKLLSNALHWLAEPSMSTTATTALGGAEQDPALLENPQMMKFAEPPDWAKINLQSFPAWPQARSGVIGARTVLSGGKGTVADWVKEAKTEGLSYIVFLEDFANLSPEHFETLKSECARLTDSNFAAIPGLRIQDEVGNHYFYCGVNVLYPPKKLLSDEGKVFVSYDSDISPKEPRKQKGQINTCLIAYTYELGGFHFTAGNYLFRGGDSPFPNYFGVYTSVGVMTRQNGKVIEDATPEYLDMIHAGQGPLPMVLDLMDDPAELKQTPWRTVLRIPLAAGNVNPVVPYFDAWHFYPDAPTAIYVTSGPQIDYWSFMGSGDYAGSYRGDFVWQGYRWRVGGKVTSPEGLKEVAVYDGAKLFRRFLPQGQKEFEFALDLSHNQQHDLVLIATDVKGNKAISGEQWDRNHRLEEFNCSDRDNQLGYGMMARRDGSILQLTGNPAITPNKRVPDTACNPASAFLNDQLLGAPTFDGGVNGQPTFNLPVIMKTATGDILAPRVGECQRLLDTGDTQISIAQCYYNYADNVPVYNCWHTLWRTEPARDFTLDRLNQFFQVDPESPLAVNRMRLRVKLKRDLPNNGMVVSQIDKESAIRWAVQGGDGQTFGGLAKDAKATPKPVSVPLSGGGYATLLDSPLGGVAVFSLSDGVNLSWDALSPMDMSVVLPAANTPQKKDETCEVNLLMVGIPRLTPYTQSVSKDALATVQRFASDYGLNGKAPSYTTTLQTGTITDQRYILNVDGRADNAFSGTLKGDLISSLPIAVSNLNDHWTAMLYDRSEKKARPLGVFENQAWATVRLHGEDDLFVGHPVTCDNRDIVLQLTQTSDNGWRLEAHNPTDAEVTVNLNANRFFDPLKDKTISDKPVVIPAGKSIFIDL